MRQRADRAGGDGLAGARPIRRAETVRGEASRPTMASGWVPRLPDSNVAYRVMTPMESNPSARGVLIAF